LAEEGDRVAGFEAIVFYESGAEVGGSGFDFEPV
jgi:hypothetical protein